MKLERSIDNLAKRLERLDPLLPTSHVPSSNNRTGLSHWKERPVIALGSWLFILSMLPSVFGGTVSVILIEFSTLLSYVGLVIVLGFAGLSILRLRKELIERRMLERTNPNYNDDDNKNINTSTLESKLEGRGDVRY